MNNNQVLNQSFNSCANAMVNSDKRLSSPSAQKRRTKYSYYGMGINNNNELSLNSFKQNAATVRYRDWICLQKRNQLVLGHFKSDFLYLEAAKKSNVIDYLSFSFFQIVGLSENEYQSQQSKALIKSGTTENSVNYDNKNGKIVYANEEFYLKHVQTGLYLSSKAQHSNSYIPISNISLTDSKSKHCLFQFKNQKIVQQQQIQPQSSFYHGGNTVNQALNYSLYNSSVQKYLQLMEGSSTIIKCQKQNQVYKSSKNNISDNTVWLSNNIDYFNIRICKRNIYNPVLLANYDTILLYNKQAKSYLGVVPNNIRRKSAMNANLMTMAMDKTKDKDKIKQQKATQQQKIELSQFSEGKNKEAANYNRLKHRKSNNFQQIFKENAANVEDFAVQETSEFCFENKRLMSYIWRVYNVQSDQLFYRNSLQQPKDYYPCLIKPAQHVLIQHLQTGYYLVKINSQFHLEKSYQKAVFLDVKFRISNNNAEIKYSPNFIIKNDSQRVCNSFSMSASISPSPINTNLPITIDKQSSSLYQISKINVTSKISAFNLRFFQFTTSLVDFLKDPKSIDNRRQNLIHKSKIFQKLYDKIHQEQFQQIDKGYFYLKHSITIISLIRLKMKQFQLQAFKQQKQINKKNYKNTQEKGKFYKAENNSVSYFQGQTPLSQLMFIENTIYQVLARILDRILKLILTIFSQDGEIYQTLDEQYRATKFNYSSAAEGSSEIKRNYKHKNSEKHSQDYKEQHCKPSKQKTLLKQLIKSLCHLLSFQPETVGQILKLISQTYSFEIVREVNHKLNKLTDRLNILHQAQSKFTIKNKNQYQQNLYSQKYYCLSLINFIIESHSDTEFDWKRCLENLQDLYQLKLDKVSAKDSDRLKLNQQEKVTVISVYHLKKSYPITDILQRNFNLFKKNKLVDSLRISHKDFERFNQKLHTNVFENNIKSKICLGVDSEIYEQQSQKNTNEKSSKNDNYGQYQNKNQYYFLYKYLKEIIRLRVINLKDFRWEGAGQFIMHQFSLKDSTLRDIPEAISFYLEILNVVQINFSTTIHISLLGSSRYLVHNNQSINEDSELYNILNFSEIQNQKMGGYKKFESNQKQLQPFLKQQDLFNFMKHTFNSEIIANTVHSLAQIAFSMILYNKGNMSPFHQSPFDEINSILTSLKTFIVSLEVFISIGNITFNDIKRIEKYVIDLIENILLRNINGRPICLSRIIDILTFHNGLNEAHAIKFGTVKNIYQFWLIKDTIQNLMIEFKQIFEIIYIQKKRITFYPFIQQSASKDRRSQNKENHFFQPQCFIKAYSSLMTDQYVLQLIPILADHLLLNQHLSKVKSNQFRMEANQINYNEKKIAHLKRATQTAFPNNQYQVMLNWSHLKAEEFIIFSETERVLYQKSFLLTSQAISKLNQIALLLNSTVGIQGTQERLKNGFLLQIQQKFCIIRTSLRSIVKQKYGKNKIVQALGFHEQVMDMIFSTQTGSKQNTMTLLQFLIEMRVFKIHSLKRVLFKYYLSSDSKEFLSTNIKKHQFFLTIAKHLEETNSLSTADMFISKKYLNQQRNKNTPKKQLLEFFIEPLIEMFEFSQSERYHCLIQKLNFIGMILQIYPEQSLRSKVLNKLMNRIDVQIYIQRMRTVTNFEELSASLLNLSKFKSSSNSSTGQPYFNFSYNRHSRELSSHQEENLSTGGSGFKKQRQKQKQMSIFVNSRKQRKLFQTDPAKSRISEQTLQHQNQLKQQINKFVFLMSILFRISRLQGKFQSRSQSMCYLSCSLSYKEILRILTMSSAKLVSYQLMKPLLVYLQTNPCVFFKRYNSHSPIHHHNASERSQYLGTVDAYFFMANQILSDFQAYQVEAQFYQANSTYFRPYKDREDANFEQKSVQKIKKIQTEIKNHKNKSFFWQLLLWTPFYQKQQGLIPLMQNLILQNQHLFQYNGQRQGPIFYEHASLGRSIGQFFRKVVEILECLLELSDKSSSIDNRFSRMKFRLKKLKRIMLDMIPEIGQSSNRGYVQQAESQNIIEQDLQQLINSEIQSEIRNKDIKNSKLSNKLDTIKKRDSIIRAKSYFKNYKLNSLEKSSQKSEIQGKDQSLIFQEKLSENYKSVYSKPNQDAIQNQKRQTSNAENISYQIIAKLYNRNKLQMFVKHFLNKRFKSGLSAYIYQRNGERRIPKKKSQAKNTLEKCASGQSLSIKFPNLSQKQPSNKSHDELAEYYQEQDLENNIIDDESDDNNRHHHHSPSLQQQPDKHKTVQLRKQKHSSDLVVDENELHEEPNSHHAFIVPFNTDLNTDTPKQTFKLQPRRRKEKITTKLFFKKSIKKVDSNRKSHQNQQINCHLQRLKLYQVYPQLKKILFDYNQYYENDFYYQLVSEFYQFFSFGYSFSTFFYHINNFIKIKRAKAADQDLSYLFNDISHKGSKQQRLQKIKSKIYSLSTTQSHSKKLKNQVSIKNITSLFSRQNYSLSFQMLENFSSWITSQKNIYFKPSQYLQTTNQTLTLINSCLHSIEFSESCQPLNQELLYIFLILSQALFIFNQMKQKKQEQSFLKNCTQSNLGSAYYLSTIENLYKFLFQSWILLNNQNCKYTEQIEHLFKLQLLKSLPQLVRFSFPSIHLNRQTLINIIKACVEKKGKACSVIKMDSLRPQVILSSNQSDLYRQYLLSMMQVINIVTMKGQSERGRLYIASSLSITSQIQKVKEVYVQRIIRKTAHMDIYSQNLENLKMFDLTRLCMDYIRSFENSNMSKRAAQSKNLVLYALVELQLRIYDTLMSSVNYMKDMMDLWVDQKKVKSKKNKQNVTDIQNNLKKERFIVLAELLGQSLAIFHNFSRKHTSIWNLTADLYLQRKSILQKLYFPEQLLEIKEKYLHINELFSWVQIKTQQSCLQEQYINQIVVHPVFDQLKFQSKQNYTYVVQTVSEQERRYQSVFMVIKSIKNESDFYQLLKYRLYKMKTQITWISFFLVIGTQLLHLLLPLSVAKNWIINIAIAVNIILVYTYTLTAFIIYRQFYHIGVPRLFNLKTAKIVLRYLPYYLTFPLILFCSVYALFDIKAMVCCIIVPMFNEFSRKLPVFIAAMPKLKKIFLFLLYSLFLSLAFTIIQRKTHGPSWNLLDQTYFQIEGSPLNFLNILFAQVKQEYYYKTIVIIFKILYKICVLYIIAAMSYMMILQMVQRKQNEKAKKIQSRCLLCGDKYSSIIEKLLLLEATQQQVRGKVEKKVSYKDNVQKLTVSEANYLMKIHSEFDHNPFRLITYFQYILHKKPKYLSPTQTMVKQKILQNDISVFP